MNLIQIELNESKKYELDVETINGDKKIVKLTRDNVAKVNAMIFTDSDYRDTQDINKPPIYNRTGNIKYVGSSSFWFNQLGEIINTEKNMSKDNYTYEKIIDNLIRSIDNENSTHLNSDKIGRKSTKEKLLKIDRPQLIKHLKYPGDKYELIEIIQKPQYKNEKNHLSFATKFCHYACLNLFKDSDAEDNYSIYDSVLKEALPKYIKKYLDIEVSTNEYENNYLKYITYIDKIREKAKLLYSEEISRNGFDHLIWYYHKGRK